MVLVCVVVRRATYLFGLLSFFQLLAVLLVLSGCAIQLAPAYDKTIIEGLTDANEQTLVLFASVSSGVSASGFAKREQTFNEVIGKFDAVETQVRTRPYPRSLLAKVTGSGPPIDAKPSQLPRLDQAPSIQAIASIVDVLTHMREFDRAGRLSKSILTGLRQSYDIAIDQALTYEKALER